jgi:large subunit ribosomal protein L3
MAAILGKKLGMTQVFREDGTVVPVTVVEAGPCKVTAIREPERDGYAAVQLAFGEVAEGKLSKPELGHLKKAGAPPMRHLVEFRDAELGGGEGDEGPKVGDDVTVAAFEPGQKVKVSGTSIGKGFQGGIKRHNFSRGPVTHGSHNVRAPGSIGASAFPARVFKGQRMPGQMGNRRITQRGLEVAEVDAERNLLLLKGSVPGSRNSVIEVRTDG